MDREKGNQVYPTTTKDTVVVLGQNSETITDNLKYLLESYLENQQKELASLLSSSESNVYEIMDKTVVVKTAQTMLNDITFVG